MARARDRGFGLPSTIFGPLRRWDLSTIKRKNGRSASKRADTRLTLADTAGKASGTPQHPQLILHHWCHRRAASPLGNTVASQHIELAKSEPSEPVERQVGSLSLTMTLT